MARMPGAAFSMGTISLSQTPAKRVGPAPTTRCLLPGWRARIILDPVAGRCAEAGFGGSNGSVVGLSGTHVQPHLVVDDMEAGQGLIPHL
jgi:hypothetical protein